MKVDNRSTSEGDVLHDSGTVENLKEAVVGELGK